MVAEAFGSSFIPSFQDGYAHNEDESAAPNLWKDLVALWAPCLGVQGEKLYDISGNGFDATLSSPSNIFTWDVCPYGHCIVFPGTMVAGDVLRNTAVSYAFDQMTCLLLCKGGTTSNTWALGLREDTADGDNGIRIDNGATSSWDALGRDSVGGFQNTTNVTGNTEWMSMAMRVSGGAMDFYLSALGTVFMGTGTVSATFSSTVNRIMLGGDGIFDNRGVNHEIALAAFYQRHFSVAEIHNWMLDPLAILRVEYQTSWEEELLAAGNPWYQYQQQMVGAA